MNGLWSRLNSGGGAIIQNLSNCDVKVDGMCCYFPGFCDPIAKCVSSTPSTLIDLPSTFPRCVCPDGYEGDGRMKGSGCTNINECDMGLSRCSQICIDLIPGFRCECRAGYRLENDGRTCRDVDECAEQTHSCSHFCENTQGSYSCGCPKGYYLSSEDNQTCIDIDECEESRISGNTSICPYEELCVNTIGSYQCGCPPGYQPLTREPSSALPRGGVASIVCEDIDECFHNSNACPNSKVQNKVSQICENISGAHLCRCLPGLKPVYKIKPPPFQAAKPVSTSDATHGTLLPSAVHPLNKFDQNIEEHLYEFGKKGVEDDLVPLPVDEVLTLKDRTKKLISENGNERKRMSVEESKERFNWASYQRAVLHCEDIDECKDGAKAICGKDAVCVNTFRSHDCVCKDENLQYDREKKACAPPEEIPRNRVCPATYCAGPCILTANGYYCGCPRGYVAVDAGKWDEASTLNVNAKSEAEFQSAVKATVKCIDLDECAVNAHVCAVGCRCKNLIGSFQCICEEGKNESYEALDDDYDILLAISNQFSQYVEKMGSKEDIVRAMNHNGPRHTVMALTSLKPTGRSSSDDDFQFNSDRWLIDQIDWSKSEYMSLPSHYESSLIPLLKSEELIRDFIRTTAAALRDSSIKVCTTTSPCVRANCPATKPCCQAHNSEYQCLPYNSPTFFNKRRGCPPNSVMNTNTIPH